MKAKLEKVIYMTVGALIAFLGYMLGTLNDSISAQSETGQVTTDEIVVQKLRVIDDKGNTIAVLGEQGQAERKRVDILQVYDENGDIVLHLGQTPDGGIIDIRSKDSGKKVVLLQADAEGGSVRVFGKKGSAALNAGAESGNLIVMSENINENMKAVVFLNADAKGGSVTVLGEDMGSGVLVATAEGSRLRLMDKNKNVKVALDSTADGGSVTVVDKDNQSAATLHPDTTVVKVISEQQRWRSIHPPTIRWNK